MIRRILALLLAALWVTGAVPSWAVTDSILTPTGQRLDTWRVSVGGVDVLRQRIQICGEGETACAAVGTFGLYVNLRNSSGNEIGVSGAPLLAETWGITKGGTAAAGATVSSVSADVNALDVYVRGGASMIQYNEDTVHVDADALMLAGAVRRDTATSGANADGDRATINVDAAGRLWVNPSGVTQPSGGDAAHDQPDAGNPLKLGARGVTSIAALTPVATNDRTDLYAGADGVLIVRQNTNLEDIVSGTASTVGTGDVAILASAGSGLKNVLTKLECSNSGTTTVTVALKDGVTTKKTYLAVASGGFAMDFGANGTPLVGTANTAWNIAASSATTTLYCNAEGFKSKL